MAIAFDAASSANSGAWISGTSTVSWSHTTAPGATLMVAGIFPGFTTDLITGATYNGVAMTQIGVSNCSGLTCDTELVYLYYILNPTSGTNTVSFTFSSNVPNAAGGAMTYTGTATTAAVIDSFNTSSVPAVASADFAPSTTVIASNCWFVGVMRQNAAAFSSISGGVNRGGYNNGGVEVFDSNATIGTGLQAPVTVTNGSITNGSAVVASIAIPAAGGVINFIPTLLTLNTG